MNTDNNDYYQGFAWALPKAFKDPLASCKFEQGDTLYNSRKAYQGSWEDALKHLQYCIQIELPVRGLKTRFKNLDLSPNIQEPSRAGLIDEVGRKNEDLIFVDNWLSDVSLSLTIFPEGDKKNIKTSQGRLYMALWKGDISFIEQPDRDLLMPRLSKDSRKDIRSTEKLLLDKYSTKLKNPQIFIMPTDETRDVLWSKYLRVKAIISKHYKFQSLYLAPSEIGLPHAMEYLPTLKFACFVFDTHNRISLVNHFKEALYAPAKNRKTNVDKFNLEMHGYLFPRNQI